MGRINNSHKVLDNFNHSCNDWISNIETKIMLKNQNIFNKKKILVYGLGKSGLSTFKFLNKENKVYLFDDEKKNKK